MFISDLFTAVLHVFISVLRSILKEMHFKVISMSIDEYMSELIYEP